MALIQVNTADQLYSAIDKAIAKSKVKKIRVMEQGKSYEDYSVSYTVTSPIKRIDNFKLSVVDGKVIMQKKAKASTRHVCFDTGTMVAVEYVHKHVPYIKVDVLGKVHYTDGTHRYED